MLNKKIYVNKAQLIELSDQYDSKAGLVQKLFWFTNDAKKLKDFINNQMANKDNQYQLKDVELEILVTILKNRLIKIIHTENSYRASPNSPINQMYVKLANLISGNNPKILSLVQTYKNDYTPNNYLLLCDSQEDIFITNDGYALPLSDLSQHIKSTESLSYSLFSNSKYAKPLSNDDILKLKIIQSVASEIEFVEKRFSDYQFHNTETFIGVNLIHYPKDRRFVSEDNYCFLIDELIDILNKQNKFYNPYTTQPFSNKDISRLWELPEILKAGNLLKTRQNYCASNISEQTIFELKKLAESLLNKNEIASDFFTPIPKAQDGYEEFNRYYQKLNETEREALNDYWIDKWSRVEGLFTRFDFPGLYLSGSSSPIKFKDVYESFGEECVHELGGSIVQMVMQLAPNIEFKVNAFLAKNVVKSIKNDMDLIHSSFITGNNANDSGTMRAIK